MKCHLFAVFDGHGGAEVAQFAAQSLPTWVKKLPAFRDGDVEKALIEAFISFDKHLTQKEVIEELKVLSGDGPGDEDEDETDELNEAIALQEEADMPIAQLLAKYNQKPQPAPEVPPKPESESTPSNEPVAGSSGLSSSSSRVGSESEKDDKQSDDPKSGESNEPVAPAANTTNGTNDSQTKVEQNGDVCHESQQLSNGAPAESQTTTDKVPELEKQDVPAKEEDSKNGESEVPKKEGKGKQRKVVVPKPKRKTNPQSAYQLFLADVDDEDESSDEGDDVPFGPANAFGDESEEDEAPADDSEDSDEEEEESDSSEDDDMDGIPVPTGDFEEPGKDSGCTAVVALIRGDTLFVANAGDSRCVVSCNGKAIEMSEDHKPEDERELNRIQKAGGKVTVDGRVNGGLNLSRALGDHTYKDNPDLPLNQQMISPEPDVRQLKIAPEHEFMILACDGIWFVSILFLVTQK